MSVNWNTQAACMIRQEETEDEEKTGGGLTAGEDEDVETTVNFNNILLILL